MVKGQNSTEIQHCQLPKSNVVCIMQIFLTKLNCQYLKASLLFYQFLKF